MKSFVSMAVLVTAFAAITTYADDVHGKTELTSAISRAAESTGSIINISTPTATDAYIETIDGLSVCSPQAKDKVIALANALIQQPHVFSVFAYYFAYVRNKKGTFYELRRGWSRSRGALLGACDIYVTVK